MINAPPLVDAGYWEERGLAEATCRGWTLPPPTSWEAWHEGKAPGGRVLPLGHRFEALHARVMQAQPDLEVLALNLVLAAAGVTLGEVDCLYVDAQGTPTHRELAVKYYLGVANSAAPDTWVGPGLVDRLDVKLTRLTEHQLNVAARAARAQVWPAWLPNPQRREIFLRGAFFSHPEHVAWPHVIHAAADRGFWCRSHELAGMAPADAPWAVLHKPWWLDPRHAEVAPCLETRALVAWVEAQGRPLFVGHLVGLEGLAARGFVVPRNWGR